VFCPLPVARDCRGPAVESCRSLRRLTTGGEALSVALQQRVREKHPATVLALHRRSQTNGGAHRPSDRKHLRARARCAWRLRAARRSRWRSTSADWWLLAAIGIGGNSRRQLTAGRFIADPAGGTANRVYRMVDTGRLRPDGVLEFIGASTIKVKIRGVRVEFGEIETALAPAIPAARSAALARDGRGQDADHRRDSARARGAATQHFLAASNR
jgi:hypothetical protein